MSGCDVVLRWMCHVKRSRVLNSQHNSKVPWWAASVKCCTQSLRPSVCPSVQCFRFSRDREAIETSNLVETCLGTRVTRGANLRSKGRRGPVAMYLLVISAVCSLQTCRASLSSVNQLLAAITEGNSLLFAVTLTRSNRQSPN